MELAFITAGQVAELFLLILAGFLGVKLRVLSSDYRKGFSDLLIYLVMPSMVLNSYMAGKEMDVLGNLFTALGLSIVAIALAIVLSELLSRLLPVGKDREIICLALSFSNAAYMGFPLISALYGSEGLLYASIFVTVFNVFLWTYGYSSLNASGSRSELVHSLLMNPVLYAVIVGLLIMLLKVPVPELIREPISITGAMTTPLAMIITGMIIASSDLGSMLKNKKVWLAMPIRLLLIPIISFALFYILGIKGMVAQVVIVLAACPTAAISSVFAVKYGHDEELAAGIVVLSTFFSIITLPFFALMLVRLV